MLRAFRPDFRIGATDIDEGRTRRKLRAITGDRYEARRISGILLDERRHLERPTPRDAETELGCRGIDKPQFRRDDAAGVRIILPAQSGGEGGAMGEAEILIWAGQRNEQFAVSKFILSRRRDVAPGKFAVNAIVTPTAARC